MPTDHDVNQQAKRDKKSCLLVDLSFSYRRRIILEDGAELVNF